MKTLNLKYLNKKLRNKTPEEIVDWALTLSEKRIATTSFGTYSAAILYLMSSKDKAINVIWCDTGYNTTETYGFAHNLIHSLELNINVYKPLKTYKPIDSILGLPGIDDPKFNEFKDIVKLEPCRRALREHEPEIWFTNIRSGQTKFRDSIDILSYSKDGILKVSPFYHWTDKDLDEYLEINHLLKNESYFDVTKVLSHRECGIHFQ